MKGNRGGNADAGETPKQPLAEAKKAYAQSKGIQMAPEKAKTLAQAKKDYGKSLTESKDFTGKRVEKGITKDKPQGSGKDFSQQSEYKGGDHSLQPAKETKDFSAQRDYKPGTDKDGKTTGALRDGPDAAKYAVSGKSATSIAFRGAPGAAPAGASIHSNVLDDALSGKIKAPVRKERAPDFE